MTAIASGVGSLFGSGKLKELEQANGKLQGKIDKRDNQIRLLNEHMRMQEERHSTEKHCQQEIHRQKLNMKMKKAVISNKGCGQHQLVFLSQIVLNLADRILYLK